MKKLSLLIACAIVVTASTSALAQTRTTQAVEQANVTDPKAQGTVRPDPKNAAAAKRVKKLPEFTNALARGDAKEAKRIFVEHGGSSKIVIAVPQPGADLTLGHVLSDPMPVDIYNAAGACGEWGWVPWGWNYQTQTYTTMIFTCLWNTLAPPW